MEGSDMDNEIIKSVQQTDLRTELNNAFALNLQSHDKCIQAGEELYASVKDIVMDAENDEEIKKYIGRANTTLKNLTERRKPITQLLDNAKKYFTSLESEINVRTQGTVVYRLQALRDAYAKRLIEEQEAMKRERERQALLASERIRVRNEIERLISDRAQKSIDEQIAHFDDVMKAVTIENYDSTYTHLNTYVEKVDIEPEGRPMFTLISADEYNNIYRQVLSEKSADLKQNIRTKLTEYRQSLTLKLPGKLSELRQIEKLKKEDAEKAAAAAALLAQKEAEEAARKEQERKAEEDKRKQAELIAAQAAQAGTLLLSGEDAMPKAKVKLKMDILDKQGYMAVLQLWWVLESGDMSLDDLAKKLKFAVTACEKAANDNADNKITSPYINWIQDVKAK